MVKQEPTETLYVVRYTHGDQEVDVTGMGMSGQDAFYRYLGELSDQGEMGGEYLFVSATPLEPPDKGG